MGLLKRGLLTLAAGALISSPIIYGSLKEYHLMSKQELENKLNASQEIRIEDYSHPNHLTLFPVDANNDGVYDALCVDILGIKLARWYGEEWKGLKTFDSSPITPEIRRLASEQARASRLLSLEILEVKRQQNQK